MKAKPCSKECAFDWAEFEIQLDTAVIHLVEEQLICPHELTVSDFMEYVLAKQEAQEQREIWEITYGDDESPCTQVL